MIPKLWFFQGAGLHQRLTETVEAQLVEHGRRQRWGHRAQVPLRDGAEALHIVRSGGVLLQDGTGLGAVRLSAGDVFGALAHEAPPEHQRPYEASALDDTTILTIPREPFDRTIRRHLGAVTVPLNPVLRSELIHAPLGPTLYTSPVQRLAGVLVHLAESHGELEADRATLSLRLRSGVLRKLSGLDRARLEWALERLRERGLVVVDRHRVVLPRLDELRQQATATQLII